MRVEIYNGDAEQLRPIALMWKQEAQGNGNAFGIAIDNQTHIDDLQRLIDRDDADLLVLVRDDAIIGYMGVQTFNSPLGKQMMASEHYWYVLPQYRIGSIALIKAAFEWARAKGCSHIQMNASKLASEYHDRVCEIYRAFGMKHFETSYIKEI